MTTIQITIDAAWLRRTVRTCAFALAVLFPALLQAGQVTIPTTFSAGSVIRASEVNANFDALRVAVNDNDTRIGNLGGLATNAKSSLVAAINEARQTTQGPAGPQGSTGPTGPAGLGPVGSVVGWLKSFPGTPALPAGYVECNGQVLADALSPFNGLTIPDLNAAHRLLRGSTTSGTTGGSDTHTHTFTSGVADHTIFLTGGIQTGGPFTTGLGPTGVNSMLTVNGSNSTSSSLPAYYEAVWVMRVR